MTKLSTVLLILSISTSAVADEVTKAVNRARHRFASQRQEHEKVLRSLYRIGRQMQRIVHERGQLEADKIGTEAQLRALAQSTKVLESQLKEQHTLLLSKMTFIHRFNSQAWMQFLLQAKNSAQLERNMKLLGLVSRHDLMVMKSYRDGVRHLAAQKQKFVDRLAYLTRLEREIEGKEKNLRDQNEVRSKVLTQIKETQKETLKKIRDLQAKRETSALSESGLLDTLDGPSFYERKGLLQHPTNGLLIRGYGILKDQATSFVTNHRGWTYQTTKIAPVRTVFDGQVAHVDYLPEYGPFVVIDHGDHFYTVYAGLGNTAVKEGDQVKEGKVIGLTGTSPYDGRLGLYFEIRHFSETVDPRSWMKGRSYEISKVE